MKLVRSCCGTNGYFGAACNCSSCPLQYGTMLRAICSLQIDKCRPQIAWWHDTSVIHSGNLNSVSAVWESKERVYWWSFISSRLPTTVCLIVFDSPHLFVYTAGYSPWITAACGSSQTWSDTPAYAAVLSCSYSKFLHTMSNAMR